MDLSSFLTCAAVLPSNVVAREKEYVSWCLSSIVGVVALERELYSACPLRRITCALTCQLRPCRVYSLSLSLPFTHTSINTLSRSPSVRIAKSVAIGVSVFREVHILTKVFFRETDLFSNVNQIPGIGTSPTPLFLTHSLTNVILNLTNLPTTTTTTSTTMKWAVFLVAAMAMSSYAAEVRNQRLIFSYSS